MKSLWPLGIILGLFLVFAGQFAAKTPYRQSGWILTHGAAYEVDDIGAPDERQHANYVKRIAEGRGLAVLEPGAEDLYETYQAHQPPLYYYLGAAWTKVTAADLEIRTGGLKLRGLNILIGMGTIVGIYFLALWGTGKQNLAFAASAFGLMPMFVALSSAISNDPLLILFCTWAMATMAKAMRDGWTVKAALLPAVFIGLGLLTKTSALALMPAVGIWALADFWTKKKSSEKPNWAIYAAILIVPILIALPWWLRNQGLYGDPLAMSAFKEAFEGSPKAAPSIERLGLIGYLVGVSKLTMMSFIGVFGYMDIFVLEHQGAGAAMRFYWGSIAIFLLFVFTGLWNVFKRQPENEKPAPLFWLTTITFYAVVEILFLQFNMEYYQAQARYLYPGAAVIAVLFGLGAFTLLRKRESQAWMVCAAFLSLLSLASVMQLDKSFADRQQPQNESVLPQ
jgi:4-amino-4-deoxy-L-arabinose transferase-like glycosyltransferase